MEQGLTIGIAGAGIGGLAVAALLTRAGHKVTVYDQFDEPGPVGSGLILQEIGLCVLAELGLRPAAEELGADINRLWGVASETGRTVLDVRYEALRPGLKGVAILRPVLFQLVYQAALDSGVAIVPGARILNVNAGAGMIMTEGGKTLGPFDLVIDALGAHSPLSDLPRHQLPYGALWATLPLPADGFKSDALEQRYEGARKMAGVMPSGRAAPGGAQTVTYFWSIRASDHTAWQALPIEDWKTQALALWPETEPLLAGITSHSDLTFARYAHRTHWPVVQGRMVHLGDAWHATSPQLGQGANMALLDAFALAKAMSGPGDVAARLEAYKRMRAIHVRLFQTMSWLFTPVYQSDSVILPWLRDWLAAPVSRIWPGPQILAAMVSGAIGAPLKRLGLKPAR
ncbi:MAG: FAD-dependent monooxygenase [Hyphomonas sp.]|nr:FAD-dependent monooxygenase [Hyphomonas sp.]